VKDINSIEIVFSMVREILNTLKSEFEAAGENLLYSPKALLSLLSTCNFVFPTNAYNLWCRFLAFLASESSLDHWEIFAYYGFLHFQLSTRIHHRSCAVVEVSQ
jgi:hypothetical protein